MKPQGILFPLSLGTITFLILVMALSWSAESPASMAATLPPATPTPSAVISQTPKAISESLAPLAMTSQTLEEVSETPTPLGTLSKTPEAVTEAPITGSTPVTTTLPVQTDTKGLSNPYASPADILGRDLNPSLSASIPSDEVEGGGNRSNVLGEPTSYVDIDAPILNNFSFAPVSIDTSTSEASVVVTLDLSDSGSGVCSSICSDHSSMTQARFEHGASGQIRDAIFDLESGTVHDGIFVAEVIFPHGSAEGTWRVTNVLLADDLGNRQYYGTSELAANGLQTELINTSVPAPTATTVLSNPYVPPTDIIGPDLIDISVTPTSGRVGDVITITVTASDDTGISGMEMGWKNPHQQGDWIWWWCDGEEQYLRPDLSGVQTCSRTLTISENNYSGEYELESIALYGPIAGGGTVHTEYHGPASGIDGHMGGDGRGGVLGERVWAWEGVLTHNIEMPSITVE